jgi:hypothetical protein
VEPLKTAGVVEILEEGLQLVFRKAPRSRLLLATRRATPGISGTT